MPDPGGGFWVETARLVLRDWREEDWPRFIDHTNTPAVMRWLGGVMSPEQQAAVAQRVTACAQDHGHCFWPIERKSDGAILGFCGLKRSDAPGSRILGEFEVGWRLREEAWGQGYAKEAATAALAAGFEQFGARQIVALTVNENRASWGLMERLGMRRRPDLDFADPRYEPPLRDTIVYSLAQEEWTAA